MRDVLRSALVLFLTAISVAAEAQTRTAAELEFREIYRELIEINTTDSVGDTTKAAEAMAARLRAAGYPAADVQVLAPHPKKGNLVARLRGSGAGKPLLLLAHLDVVEARREDWSTDPFKLLEQDGYFYGRGSIDDKAMAAIFVDTLIRLKKDGFAPSRDLILALTADEELGSSSRYNGVRWLLANHRALIDAELALNEGGGGEMRGGRHLVTRVQTSEKVPIGYRLEVTNPGGHSSRPVKDNAIYHLAAGLVRLGQFDFPTRLGEASRLYFERTAALHAGPLADDMRAVARIPPDPDALARLAADPGYNALLRTTCVATRLEGGHANNALPQMARAVVNCRVLPDERPEDVQRALVRVLADDRITIKPTSEWIGSPPSPLDPDIMARVERLTAQMWPGALVIPTMSTGATDSRWLRNAGIPSYGVSGLFTEAGENRAHGKDERIGVKDLYAGREFLYRLVRELGAAREDKR
jgi:acetylornithine deacetylase/succinyl-diaminopimelate desuccinylase-like protein